MNRKRDELLIILKSVVYRIWGTIITIIISFIFTGDIKLSLGIGLFEVISKIVLYYVYEKIWNYFISKINKKKNE